MGKQVSDLYGFFVGAQYGILQVLNGRGIRESLFYLISYQGNVNEFYSRQRWICSLGGLVFILVLFLRFLFVKWVEWAWLFFGFQEGRGRSGGASCRNRVSARKFVASFFVYSFGWGWGKDILGKVIVGFFCFRVEVFQKARGKGYVLGGE